MAAIILKAAAANVSHGALNVTGANNIKIAGGTLDTTTLKISNSDDSKVNVNSKGVTVSAGRAIGVLIAEGSFKGSNEIEINNATLKGDIISIKAMAAPVVNVDALALSAGVAFAGSGLFAGSINDSAAKISGTGATLTSNELNINAENNSAVKTNTGSASGSLLASGSLTGILNNSNAAAAVDFQNATVNAANTSVNVNSSPSQKVGLVSLGAGGLLAATGSIAGVISNPSASANMSAKEITADDLKITATADSTPEISVKGLTVGAIASGSNLIQSVRDLKVDAKLKADKATLNNLDIDAKTASAPNLNVNGDGGGLVGVSPAAAVLNDNLTQSNSINLDGTLNLKNSVNVNAQNSDAGTYTADALGAAVIGASGVELKRSSDSNAAINFTNANIETEGAQNYTAINELGYKLDLEAAGYGGLNASAGNLENKTTYAANINVNNSKLTATGESSNLTFDTQTTGNASSLNNLKAAGAVETVISNSGINTTFDNQINLNSSTLTTEGKNSAIKLASSDLTEQKYHTIANIQGGVAGVGVANTNNTLTRSNAVKLNKSTINAANNVYLLSGKNVEGVPSKLTIRNSLNMTISGGNLSENTNPTVTLTAGKEIFDPSSINFNATSTMENPFLADYNKALSDMQAYTSWFDGYKKDSSAEKLSFKNYEHYLNFVYNMALKYDKTNLAAHRQYLSDAAGNSSWYKGNFNADWNRWKNLMLAKYDSTTAAPAGAITSGGAVSVIAKTLNINGLIQSGFNNYVATANNQAITKLKLNGNKTLDDDAVIGDKKFSVNNTDAETIYNSQSGIYDKVVGLYYNPKTNSILTDPLQVSGGVVYLKAQDIVSTGNGKIVAAGGGADINIDNSTYTPLVVKDIDTTGRPEPLIMINGVNYTKSSQYLPNSKAVYAWTGGINYSKIETKSSETKELFWGLVKIKSTEDLVNKLNTEKIFINTISTSTPPKAGSNLQNGVFTDYSGDGSLFSITTAKESGKKVYGETSVTKKEKNIWESIASAFLPVEIVTTYTYTWTETTPNYAGSTYRINAAQPIKIQTANKTNSTINITSGGNVNVESDLNAGANGTINLTSKLDDIITSAGSKITSSKVNLNAGENIDVTLGLPENRTTELKVTGLLESSREFNVKINANTPLKNVDISGDKNVSIVGLDDISGKINAKNLEITSKGNIDLTTQISDTFTAQGDKSIKVTQTSGDIKIGKIASKGDISLTAQNGAIVNSVDSAVNMTGAAEKISAWQAAGLISDKDSDNSATNSAQAEKTIRLEGLENLFKRWALKDDGTIDETIYNQFINNTADRTKLNDEQVIQMELYQSLQKSTNYGFSKNQLLYAVQESLLNPSAGITASISDPIITGKNITLTAKSLGKELSSVTYSDLSNIKTLEKLSGIKGGDVTFNGNGSITVKEQSPITIAQSTAQDKLNITTQGNTFVSGTASTKFNVNTPINAGNKKVVLMTGSGIDASKGISAKEIELYAGAGDLNAKIISGTLTANALNDITINANTTLPIKNVTSNDYTIIKANGNIIASDKNSVIRSTDVKLTAINDIGTQSLPLTIIPKSCC